jgi:ABC-type sugar transport system substrate-binding protein
MNRKHQYYVLSLLVVIAMAFSITACQQAVEPTQEQPSVEEPSVSDPTQEEASTEPVSMGPSPRNGEQFVVAWTPQDDPIVENRAIYDITFKQTFQEDMGWGYLFCSGKGDPVTQNDCIDQFIAQDVDLIIVHPIDAAAVGGAITRANEKGIPVVSFISYVPASTGAEMLFTLDADQVQAGRNAGEELVELLTEKYGKPMGKVLEVQIIMTSSAGQDRYNGFHEIVDQYPEIEVVSKDSESDPAKGTQIIQDWFSANPDTDALYTHSDCSWNTAVKNVLEPLGLWGKVGEENHVFYVSEDGCGQSLYYVKCGYFDMITDFAISDLAPVAADMVIKYLTEGEVPEAGRTLEFPDRPFQYVTIDDRPDLTIGPVAFVGVVRIDKDGATDPALFGNALQDPPNGLTACEE